MRFDGAVSRLTLIAVTLALAKPAVAQDDGVAPAAAKAHLADGNRLFKATRYEEALGEYEAAFRAYPSPKLHFNLGQTYRLLGRNEEARVSFGRFLNEATDAPADLRAEAGAYLALLTPPATPSPDLGSTAPGAALAHDPAADGPAVAASSQRRWPIWVGVAAVVVATGAAAIYFSQSGSTPAPVPGDIGGHHGGK